MMLWIMSGTFNIEVNGAFTIHIIVHNSLKQNWNIAYTSIIFG